MSSITEKYEEFADFDNKPIYDERKALALDPNTRNFVVEFGKHEARIAFNLEADGIGNLLKEERSIERPIRWM
jgi:hypothetical protein